MKKFLIFCLICVVTVSLGLMTYRFLTLEETLAVNQTVFEINKGEEVPLEVTRENVKPNTVITYESLDEDIVYYDMTLGKFIAKAQGGKARLRITSSVKGSVPIMIAVTVGDGTESCPYFIKSAEDLAKIGVSEELEDGTSLIKRPLDAYYSLSNDIDLSTYNEGKWTPIGSTEEPFTGVLYANKHTISGLKVQDTFESAGIFAKIGMNTKGTNNITGGLTITGANIAGEFSYAGALAGINEGLVTRISVENSTISSSKDGAIVGSLFGLQNGQLERVSVTSNNITSTAQNTVLGGLVGQLESKSSIKAIIDRSYAEGVNLKGNYILGGIAGYVKGGMIVNCYSQAVDTDGTISTESTQSNVSMGGLAGKIEVVGNELEATIVDSYSTVKITGLTSQKKGQLIGHVVDKMVGSVPVKNKLYGLYYEATNNSSMLGLGYIQTVGVVIDREVETSNYEFIFNTLNSTVDQARANKIIFSHKNVISSREKTYNWETDCVWVISQEGYPTLDLDGAYFDISEITDSVSSGYDITSMSDLLTLQEKVNSGSADYSKPYVIRADIDLSTLDNWIAIGTDANPFNGILTCEMDENGAPMWKVTGLKTQQTVGNNGIATTIYNGLFGVIGGQGKVSNIYLENVSVRNGQYTGAIAAKNYGIINNCLVVATNTTSTVETNKVGATNDSNIFVGGAVAYNEGTVSNVQVKGVAVKALNSTDSTKIYLGGVVAYNLNIVENSSYTASVGATNQLVSEQKCQTYLGGVVGYNGSVVTNCYASKITYRNGEIDAEASVSIKSNTNYDTNYVGGVVGVSENNASISKSFAELDIEGTNVGGVVSLSYGKVEQCYSVSNLTGYRVGGIVYMLANGEITDCYTGGTLFGTTSSSNKAGLAYEISLLSEEAQTCAMKHCFSYNTFDGVGSNFYDVHFYDPAHTVRIDDYWALFLHYTRNFGYVFDSIFDYSVAGNAQRTNKKIFEWDWVDWKSCEKIISDYRSNPNYYSYQEDCGMTTEQIKSEDGANVFRTYGFDEKIWKLGDGQYPTLRNVVKAK